MTKIKNIVLYLHKYKQIQKQIEVKMKNKNFTFHNGMHIDEVLAEQIVLAKPDDETLYRCINSLHCNRSAVDILNKEIFRRNLEKNI